MDNQFNALAFAIILTLVILAVWWAISRLKKPDRRGRSLAILVLVLVIGCFVAATAMGIYRMILPAS
jgi:uncharacterized membrane protein